MPESSQHPQPAAQAVRTTIQGETPGTSSVCQSAVGARGSAECVDTQVVDPKYQHFVGLTTESGHKPAPHELCNYELTHQCVWPEFGSVAWDRCQVSWNPVLQLKTKEKTVLETLRDMEQNTKAPGAFHGKT